MKPYPIQFKTAKLTELKNGNYAILIKFPWNNETLQQVKSIPGRIYFPEDKFWTCPLKIENLQTLKKFGFQLDSALQNFIVDLKNKSDLHLKNLPDELFSYQKIGVEFIEKNNGRALITDEQGLGKTCQSLTWLKIHPELFPVIIVCPASVKYNWAREAKKWLTNPDLQIISGTQIYNLSKKIIIINYDIVKNWLEKLIEIQPKVLILDEVQAIKNGSTIRTKAIKKLAKNVKHVIGLSGTPILNRPIEFFNAINLIDPFLFPSQWRFAMRYCGAKHNGFGWDFNGNSNTVELYEIITNAIMIRRLKKDVLPELPEKIFSILPFEINNRDKYIEAEKDFISFIRKTKGEQAAERVSNAEIITKIETLKQIAVDGKILQIIDWINEFLETGEKLIIFGVHKFILDIISREFKNISVKIDGSTSSLERQKNVDLFQTDPTVKIFIGNIKAAGVGINLTAASNILFLELPWTPAELSQAWDRSHRIGQSKKVIIYQSIAIDTIEEKIAELIDKKRIVLDAILDGVETDTNSLLLELINNYK
ncbi:MAG: DEAD/DEAH box helicase [Clostridia bacterium]